MPLQLYFVSLTIKIDFLKIDFALEFLKVRQYASRSSYYFNDSQWVTGSQYVHLWRTFFLNLFIICISFLPTPTATTIKRQVAPVDSEPHACVVYLVGVCWMDGWTWLMQSILWGMARTRWEGSWDTGSSANARLKTSPHAGFFGLLL